MSISNPVSETVKSAAPNGFVVTDAATLRQLRDDHELAPPVNPYKDFQRSALDTLIPGYGLWRLGKSIQGVLALSVALLALLLMIRNGQMFYEGLASLGITLLLSVVSWGEMTQVMTTDILEFWIAPVYLITAFVGAFYFSARSYRKILSAGVQTRASMSLTQIAWREFKKRTVAVGAMFIAGLLYSVALLAPMIAPFDPNEQKDFLVTAFQPPFATLDLLVLKEPETQNIPLRDGEDLASRLTNALIQKNFSLRLRGAVQKKMYVSEYQIDGEKVIYKQGVRSGELPIDKLYSSTESEFRLRKTFAMGTDQYGRDILSRVIYGSRISLSIGFMVVLIAVTLGTVLGVTAGYFGGWVDNLIMRFVDVLNAFPTIFLILIMIASYGNSIFLIILIISLTSWTGVSRLVRGQILALKEQEFVQAAKALGLSDARIIFRHLLPNSLTPVIIAATLRIGTIIITEASLSFLGLGVQPPTASWGNIISEGRDNLLNHWWISTFPGLAIVLTVVCFNLIGDGLRDALDPRMRD